MQYLKIDDENVSIFDICQAYMQLESDYNVGGWLRERPSNQRRKESIGCQLARMQYNNNGRWIDIESTDELDFDNIDSTDDDVRHIYCLNVLQWGLFDAEDLGMKATIRRLFSHNWLQSNYPQVLE